MRHLTKLALVLVLAAISLGAATDSRARFNDLGHKLMCTCGCGQVLLECNHVGCTASDRMRGELMAAMQRGDSDDQILNWFVQKYGNTVLSAPTKTGFNRVAWIMPYLSLLVGIALTVVLVRAWKKRFRPAPAAITTMKPEELDRMRQRIEQETEI